VANDYSEHSLSQLSSFIGVPSWALIQCVCNQCCVEMCHFKASPRSAHVTAASRRCHNRRQLPPVPLPGFQTLAQRWNHGWVHIYLATPHGSSTTACRKKIQTRRERHSMRSACPVDTKHKLGICPTHVHLGYLGQSPNVQPQEQRQKCLPGQFMCIMRVLGHTSACCGWSTAAADQPDGVNRPQSDKSNSRESYPAHHPGCLVVQITNIITPST